MTREIVTSFGGVRAMLEKRRYVGRLIELKERLADRKEGYGGPMGYPTSLIIEKVPDRDEYTFAPRGTNNPQGARMQHADFYRREAQQLREEYAPLLQAVTELICEARDADDRMILECYYCQRMRDEEIADAIRYSRSNVNKRRWEAIRALEMRYG